MNVTDVTVCKSVLLCHLTLFIFQGEYGGGYILVFRIISKEFDSHEPIIPK